MLAELAVNDAAAFATLVATAREALPATPAAGSAA
jgi:ribosomal protein L20